MSIFRNNPVLVFLFIAVVGFTIYMGMKMIEEIKLNKALNQKQRSMRIKTMRTAFKTRIAKLATATALPVVVLAVMFVAIEDAPTQIIQQRPLNLAAINSAEDVRNIINDYSDTFADNNHYNIFSWRGDFMLGDAEVMAPTNDALDLGGVADQLKSDNEGTGSDDFSETNNQVAGVDEMDNVLTDAKYMYVMNYDKVQIILAYTNEGSYDVLNIYKEFDFDQFQPENTEFYPIGMYVDEDQLIVIGNVYETTCVYYEYGDIITSDGVIEPAIETGEPSEIGDILTDEAMPNPDDMYCYNYYQSTTKAFVFDKDEDFALKDTYSFSGGFVGTRKIGDDLYFVTTEYIPYYLMREENKTVDYVFDLDEYLPTYTVNGQSATAKYEEIVYVKGTEPTSFTAFYGINLESSKTTMEVVLGEAGYNLYVSQDNIYLAGTVYEYDQTLAEKYSDEDYVYNEETFESPYSYYTSILKMTIDGGDVEFNSTGAVEGVNLDQFSMDEHNGFLRIITTTNNWWWWGGGNREVINRLSILDENMKLISEIDEGIGEPGESVFATRFAGNYGYVVTFLQTDPFYVLDLSDPYNPTILSELKIPGFSDYLQPINEDFILGIGYGDNEGGTQGLRISLYDVSDKNSPAVLADSWTYEYSNNGYMWTSTVYNHKDLLVSVDKGIIALPYTRNGYDETDSYWTYNTGILVLNIDIENGTLSDFGDEYMVEHSDGNSYDTYVYKSKFIDDYFYTVSSKYVKVSTIADPENILKTLQIGESWTYDMPEEVNPEAGVVDPVGTEIVCADGFTIDGDVCVEDVISVDNILIDFEHIKSWNEILTYIDGRYAVYFYSEVNADAVELQEQAFEFGLEQRIPSFFVNINDIEGDNAFDIGEVPYAIIVDAGAITSEASGIDAVMDFLLSIE